MSSSTSPDPSSIRPEVQNFFRDIKEHPDDDTPRLIFADWLQEHGDPDSAARGEFLRSCVLRHRLSPDDPSNNLLKRREGELFTEHRWAWLGPLADQARNWGFERGLIQIVAQAEKVLIEEVAVWARTEAGLWIDALTLAGVTTQRADQLTYSPLLGHLNRLDLSNNPYQPSFVPLFHEPCLPYLTELILSHNRLTVGQIACLTVRPHSSRLRILDLRHNRLDDTAAYLLADDPFLKNLCALRLGHNRFSADGIARLRQAFGDRVEF
jgi:uncharacterized protein (TIGR02996 family)